MGLAHPIANKSIHRFGNENFRGAVVAMQGCREEMEDTHCVILDMKLVPKGGLFGVFDGHSGKEAADFMSLKLPAALDGLAELTQASITKALLDLDREFLSMRKSSGCTACFCVVNRDDNRIQLVIANVGDSRCLLIKADGSVKQLTEDHKPARPQEYQRIRDAGGYVSAGRVCGQLALSRAIGDAAFKGPSDMPPEKQQVIAVPDVYTVDDVAEEDVLLVGCDGLFERLDSNRVGNEIYNAMKASNGDPAAALSQFFSYNLVAGSQDNMTAVLVQFKDGTTYHSTTPGFEFGPIYERDANSEWYKYYVADLQKHGYTIEDAIKATKPPE